MDRREEIRKELEEMGTNLPEPNQVEAPDGYFEKMQEEILQSIAKRKGFERGESKLFSMHGQARWYQWVAAAAIAGVLFAALWFITPEPQPPMSAEANNYAEEWIYLQTYSYELNDAMLYELQAALGQADLFLAVDFPEQETEDWLEEEGVFEEEIIIY